DVEENEREEDVEQAEQDARQEHPQGQTGIASVSLSFHRESASLEARGISRIVALAVVLAALWVPAAAQAKGGVAVIVRPPSAVVFSDPAAAHGLLIAGEGATVGRRTALASLLRCDGGHAVVDRETAS